MSLCRVLLSFAEFCKDYGEFMEIHGGAEYSQIS